MQMNAAVVHAYGEKPRYEPFEEPVAGEGEAIVKVAAAGLHPLVRAMVSGKHYGSTTVLPMVPGIDGVGRLADGTRVYFGMTRDPFGPMAERCVVSRQNCLPLPDTI